MSPSDDAIHIGSRRELLVDDALIDRRQDIDLRLNPPTPREVAIVHDAPWEGNTCFYHTVIQDDDHFKMYYRGAHYDEQQQKGTHEVACYAESEDGIIWRKPNLGLVEFQGSRDNNIIWDSTHNFAVFKDTNPACSYEARYKALAGNRKTGLMAYQSGDGIHWSPMQDTPVITHGAFDSQNLAFWDPNRQCYAEYHRDFKIYDGERVRDIMTGTSEDFLTWTPPEWLAYSGVPVEHLYTNQVIPYYRAPHIYMGFPKRFIPTRNVYGHQHNGVSDVVFMTSRDGRQFHRWGEALIRPGLQPERWENRNNFVAHGIMETASGIPGTPKEMTLYSMEGYYRGENCQMRRYTWRLDGCVSAHARLSGGELITKPLIFDGKSLQINFATSAAGSVRIELQQAHRQPVEHFTLADSEEIYGDAIERQVSWNSRTDVSHLAGQPVRIRFILSDAEIFAFRFV